MNQSGQNLTKEELKTVIAEAFRDVVLGDGIGLLEASEGIDMCVDARARAQKRNEDERLNWQSLTDDDVSIHLSALWFTDPEGMRFLLPAFMIHEIDCEFDRWAVSTLSSSRFIEHGSFSLLDRAQVQAVEAFLNHFLQNPEEEAYHGDIASSLKTYWRRLPSQPMGQSEPNDPGQLGGA